MLRDLAQRAYSNYETLQNSYDLALLCKDLDGCRIAVDEYFDKHEIKKNFKVVKGTQTVIYYEKV